MKPYLLLSIFSLSMLISCIDDPFDNDPKSLPPITTTGENTFGCLVNGELFVPKSTTKSVAIFQRGFLQILAGIESPDTNLALITPSDSIKVGFKYDLTDTLESYTQSNTTPEGRIIWFEKEHTRFGHLEISYLNKEDLIVSGTFQFEAINDLKDTLIVTNGRFDLQYIP